MANQTNQKGSSKSHASVAKKAAKNFSRSVDRREDRGMRQTKLGTPKNASRK